MSPLRRVIAVLTLLATVGISQQTVSAQATPPGDRPELALQLGHSLPIVALAYSPDGKLLVSGSNDNSVKIWDAASRELVRTLYGHNAAVRGVAWSPDGETLATGDEDGVLKFWNPQTGVLVRQWARLNLGVRGLAYSPDGNYLSAACGIRGTGPTRDERGQWVMWDVRDWKVVHRPMFDKALLSVAFSPEGNIQAFGSNDRSVTIRNTQSGAQQARMQVKNGFPSSLAFYPDGSALAANDNNKVQLWEAATGAPLRTLTAPSMTTVFSLAFAREGSTLATASLDKSAEESGFQVRLWNTATGQVQETWPGKTVTYALAWSPDGSTLASGAAGEVRLHAAPAALAVENAAFAARRRWVRAIDYSPDGRLLASAGGSNGEVLLWDAQTGALRRVLRGHKDNAQVLALAFSPDGRTLATGCGDSAGAEILVWNAQSGALVHRLRGRTRGLNALAWSPDGKVLATAANTQQQKDSPQSEEVNLWNTQTGALMHAWRGRPGFVSGLAFSPDGAVVASAQSGAPWRIGQPGDNAVTLRNAGNGEVLGELAGHSDNISAVAFSPNGALIASASKDKTVRLWNARTRQPVRVLAGHTDWVRTVAFSPDGSTLLSGGRDNSVRLWDVASGKPLRVLSGHEGDVMSATWSPDGKLLASGSVDTTVRFWNAADGRQLLSLLTAPAQEETPQSDPLWLAATPEGYYHCAEGADYLIKWRFGGKLMPFYHFEETYRRPDLLQRVLRGERIAARPLLLTRVPPAIRIMALANIPDKPGKLRILVQAADDGELQNSNFQFYVNGVLMPDTLDTKPIVVDGKPIMVDGKALEVNARPIIVDGKPIIVDGKPIVVDGKPIVVDGKPITADGRGVPTVQQVSATDGREPSVTAGGGGMAKYAFHRLYVMDVVLPRGEEKVVLRAVVTDSEGNKSDDGLSMRRKDIEPVKGDLYLVAVGVSSYRNPLYNINYAAADARSIAATLEAQEGGQYKKVHSVVLSDAEANAKAIRDALAFLKNAKPEDMVMVFLSGHGIAANGKNYFAPWNVFVRDLSGTSLEWREIVSSLSGLYAKKLLFTDACHSGAKLGNWQATSSQLTETVRRESGIVMFASSQGDEFSFEDKEVKQGNFSLALAEAFAGKADIDGDGSITLPELAMYVPKRVSRSTNGLQNPQLVLVQDFNPQTVLAKVLAEPEVQAVAQTQSAQ